MKTPQLDRQQFLANLEKSGLLGPKELDEILPQLPNQHQGREVAAALVRLGKLTRYQATLLLAGRTRGFILGPYTLLRQRGKGGLGRVYKALHRTMNRIVAIKVLVPTLIKTDQARAMFQREVIAIGRLIHPNIVAAYDAKTSGERCYLVMEYIAGPDLDRLVRKQGPLRPPVACEVIRQAAMGLQHAFEQGMLHRDIKPANLLLQRSPPGSACPWTVKLVDFGLARLQSNPNQSTGVLGTILIRENTVLGTPDYLSPEQCRDLHQVDIRSDLYSLGCTFYYVLSGRVPFPGGTPLDKMVRQAGAEPEPVEQLRPGIPVAVAEIVRRLMAKNPDDRFQTPAELVRALAPLALVGSGSTQEVAHDVKPAGDESNIEHEAVSPRAAAPTPATGARLETPAVSVSSLAPEAKSADKAAPSGKGDEGRAPYGLLIALGMFLIIILLAVLLSNR
jgi:serine/threonine-protein kinase